MTRLPRIALAGALLTLAGCQTASVSPLLLSDQGQSQQVQSSTAAAPISRELMKSDLFFLASDRLEGRGIATDGLDVAADFIAARFRGLGLQPLPALDGYFQPFEINTAESISDKTTLIGPSRTYKLREDFTAASFSAEKAFAAPLVFAGYSIVNKDASYDDYAGLDVKGKVVLAMRFEPHDEHGKSRWAGNDYSVHAHLENKAKRAAEHGATALILVNPPNYHKEDALLPFSRQFVGNVSIPVLHVKRSVADELLKAGGAPQLAELQKKIDESARPASVALGDQELKGNVSIRRTRKTVKNVVGMIRGQGPGADQYVIVGAHYDHLGWGGPGSLMNMPLLMRQPGVTEPANGQAHGPATRPASAPASAPTPPVKSAPAATAPATRAHAATAPTTRAIHHGADDNASGTVAMLELARAFSHRPAPPRTLIFIAFTAEENGLLGSGHFTRNPPVDLKRVAAMLNLDMVGRVRKHLLYVGGGGTAAPFESILKKADADSPLEFKNFGKGGLGPSDHMSFAIKKVPVLFFFSGTHEDYHRPTDTADKINYEGMEQVVRTSIEVIDNLLTMPMSKYVDEADKHSMTSAKLAGEPGQRRASLGVVPDYGQEEDGKGVRIGGTVSGSPAEQAGLQGGDVILKMGNESTSTLMELSNVLASHKPGDKLSLTYRRGDKVVVVEITLSQRGG